jgi:diguanylate cyclase (GGDEF)-like protein/PAS domain S-box-containing protein
MAEPADLDALYRSLVDDAFGFTVALATDGEVAFVSRSVTAHLGYDRAELVGTAVADFVHPDDLDRALMMIAGSAVWGAPRGNAAFRLRHRDGSWHAFDVTASEVTDGEHRYLAVAALPVDYQRATDEVLRRLLADAGRAEALRSVLDVFSWELNDAAVAIAWREVDPTTGDPTDHVVSTGLPDALTGLRPPAGSAWAMARETGKPVLDLQGSTLSPQLAELALACGRGGLWVVPVHDRATAVPALVSVWARRDGPRPDGHAWGMEMATTYVELILRWTQGVDQLRAAAMLDPLTGLGNRKALFDALEGGDWSGALLYCDLDRFKPINDDHGHAAGDRVLAQVGRRIGATVRAGDLVARAGGDEFVVLARHADRAAAAALAERIRTAVEQPISLAGDQLQVGVTIGIALDATVMTEATLADADHALMAAKGARRGSVAWHEGGT